MTAEERIVELDHRGVELRDIMHTVNREFRTGKWNARLVRQVLRKQSIPQQGTQHEPLGDYLGEDSD